MSDEAFSTPDMLPRGARIGKYEVVRVIGSGGMGAVYEALHPELKKRVAIKTLHRAVAMHPQARQRFLREGEAASRIRHPHVVDVTDVGMHDGQPFLVMELLDGVDLSTYLADRGHLPATEAVDMMLPVIAAVGAGHDEGVIHRDLKPHNVFLSWNRNREPHPKVLDFGVSKLLDGTSAGISLTGTEAVMGTVAYMSPEQAKGAKYVDVRTDQYALGLLLYECLTGARGHEGDNALAVLRLIGDGHIEPPSARVSGLPLGLEDALMQSLRLDPNERYATVYDFGKALLPYASERGRSLWRGTFERPRPSTGARVVADAGPGVAAALDLAGAPGGIASTPSAGGRSGGGHGRSPSARPAAMTADLGARGDVPFVGEERPSSDMGIPPSRPPSGGLTPSPGSTLERSAAEMQPMRRSRGTPWKWVVAMTAVGVAAGGVAIVQDRMRMQEEPATGSVAGDPTATGSAPSPSGAANPGPAPAPGPSPVAAPRKYQVAVTVTPPEAVVTLDDVPAGRGKIERELDADGKAHTLRVTASGYETHVLTFVDAPPPPNITLKRVGSSGSSARRPSRPATSSSSAPGTSSPATTSPPGPATRVGANQAPIIKE